MMQKDIKTAHSTRIFKTFHSRKNEKSGTGEGSFTGRDQQTAEGLPETGRKPGSIWQLLDGIKKSGLQNDAFLDLLYEMIGERVAPGKVKLLFFVSWNV